VKRDLLYRLVLGIFGVAVLVTIALALNARRHQHRNVVMLPDGTRLEFLKLVSGTDTFTTDSRWQQLLRRHLPRRLSLKLPSTFSATCSSSTNAATVFFKVTALKGTLPDAVPWSEYVTEDSAGLQYRTGASYCSFGGSSSNRYYGLLLMAYPRRDPDFTLRLLDSANTVVANFVIPNPSGGKWPTWTPLPMPQTQTNGAVMLTLRSIREQGNPRSHWITPAWTVASTDPQWSNAQPRMIYLEDATGNQASMLSKREPAWKMRALVYRTRPGDFGPQDELVVPALSAPGPEGLTKVEVKGSAGGVVVKVRALVRPGELYMTNGTSFGYVERKELQGDSSSSNGSTLYSWVRPYPFLLIETLGMQPDDELHLITVDGNGAQSADYSASTYSTYAGGVVYTARVPKFSAGATVNYVVRISRPLRFEFLVNPRDVQPGGKQ